MVRVGINGFGRIGRMVLRACLDENIQVVAVNDAFLTLDYMAYLFKYDSTHGTYPCKVYLQTDKLVIDGKHITLTREKDPALIPWSSFNVDFVIESTGIFTTYAKASQHLNAGAKYVIVTAPSQDIPMFVIGVNHKKFSSNMRVISLACSTTNCLAPLLKVLNDNFGVTEALLTSVHAMSPTQKVIDSPGCGNRRESRGALQNIIPSCTGASASIGHILPELNGKVTGMAMRIPIVDVSALDLTVHFQQQTNYEEVKRRILAACVGPLKDIMSWTDEDVVSSDFIGNPHSCIFDIKSGIPLNGQFMKFVCWYDNEFAYARRIADMIHYMKAIVYPNKEARKPGGGAPPQTVPQTVPTSTPPQTPPQQQPQQQQQTLICK